jgi:hypothetical protein
MPAGRSPPILPRLNPLTAGHSAGRKPPMPYKFAMQRMRERQRLAKGMKQIAAIGGAVAPPKRVDVLAAKTAPTHSAPARALERAGHVTRQAQRDMVAHEAQQPARDAAATTPEPHSLRPPRLVEVGRYAGLKNAQPVECCQLPQTRKPLL